MSFTCIFISSISLLKGSSTHNSTKCNSKTSINTFLGYNANHRTVHMRIFTIIPITKSIT